MVCVTFRPGKCWYVALVVAEIVPEPLEVPLVEVGLLRRPRAPEIPSPSWVDRALCRSVDPLLFQPVEIGARGPARWHEAAFRVCGVCPVAGECLAVALSMRRGCDRGVWAGTTPAERRKMRSE